MKNIPGLLLLTFMGFFDFTCASGFPEVSAEHLVVEMEDGSHFKGLLKEDEANKLPYWLRPSIALPKSYNVFILEESDARFSSKLEFIPPALFTSLSINPNQHNLDRVPKYAEIRSGIYHFTARNFHLHERIIKGENQKSVAVYPPRNYVYILLPNGNIYTSVLEPHQADHRDNRGRYSTPILARMQQLTASAASSSQTSASGLLDATAEYIVVDMADNSHFKGLLKEYEANKFPSWLKPRPTLPKFYHVFIVKDSDARFSSKLQFILPSLSISLPINDNQHNLDYGPKYAEIHSGSDHLIARNFRLHERIIKRGSGRNVGVPPSRNHVYISLPNGNIYASILEPHQADHRENRRGYPTPELTRIETLTASGRPRSSSNSSQ